MPVIAMTREIGSLGADIAEGIARKLSLTVIHSEIVANQLAGRLGVEEDTLKRYIGGKASLFERLQINRRKLSRYTCEEILRLALGGNVLIRGWGAATLLSNVPVLSVRVCAPMDFRVGVMMERLRAATPGAPPQEDAVRQDIERFDAARTRAMRATFNVEQEDPLLYHVVLNTARLPVDTCVALVCELASHPRFRDSFAARSALANRLLEARVNAALDDEIGIGLAPAGVSVSATSGNVTLIGTSSNGRLRAEAEKVASRIDGVRHVENRILSVPNRGGTF